ncbi:pescadillo [Nematocida homosporus]|uniref:pescadillo n=1 Tax=Nematocida homosporus TaxID=1912981 RepID=UPI002220BE25|nr:pescadillo [Nematocida homosporus]KAI5184899.1 pescadillo [Nematocida homosporus]
MSRPYTNIIVKRSHVTRDEALICLNTTSEEFDRLCILTNTHPFVPSKDKLTNRSTRIQYRLTDIHRIRESEPYKKAHLKIENERKREVYKSSGRSHRIKELADDRMDYGRILLEKYPSFDDIYEDLGETLTSLIVSERVLVHTRLPNLKLEQNILAKTQKELTLFYLYIYLLRPNFKTFLTPSGAFYSIYIQEYEVFWKEAFPLVDEEDALGIDTKILYYHMEYNAYLLEKVNFRLFNQLSPALLPCLREFRAAPSSGHFKAADILGLINRVKEVPEYQALHIATGIFKDMSFYLGESCQAIALSLVFLVVATGGTITEDPSNCSMYLCTVPPADFQASIPYAHPQIIYDSINRQAPQDIAAYRPGTEIPDHVSPFQSSLQQGELDLINTTQRRKDKINDLLLHRK